MSSAVCSRRRLSAANPNDEIFSPRALAFARSSANSSTLAGFKVIGAGGASEWHLQVSVDIDAAGKNEFARSLQHSRWHKKLYLAIWGRMLRSACSAWHFTSEQEAKDSWPWDDSRRFVMANGVEPDEFAADRTEGR